MILQSQQVVVYRMVDDEGREYALSRFILPKDVLIALNDGRFPQCLKELMSVSHGCLRPVIDGGLDPVDRSPWLATYWWEGKTLQDRIQDKELTHEDVYRVEEHAKSAMSGVGQFASFLSFDPGKIVAVKGATGDVVETFTIDLYQWFLSWATGRPPAPDREPNRQLAGLLSHIRKNVSTPMPRASSPMLPPPKTTSLNPSTIPLTASLVTGATPPPSGTVPMTAQVHPGARVAGVQGQPQSGDPLAAYRKQVTTGQKVGVAAAIGFIIAAVGGIGYFINKENSASRPAVSVTVDPKAQPIETRTKSPSILEKLRLKAEQEKASGKRPRGPEFEGKIVPKAIILEVGDGDVIEGDDPPAVAVSQSEAASEPVVNKGPVPGKRPELGEMYYLDTAETVNLTSHAEQWAVVEGDVKAKTENGLLMKGPSDVKVEFGPDVQNVSTGPGDRVEIIGWIDSSGDSPKIRMYKPSDLVILEKGSATDRAGQGVAGEIYRLKDQLLLREFVGKNVTVVATVVALNPSDDDRLHLMFDEEGAGFSASVNMDDRDDNIDYDFLSQFVGEQVRVQGRVLLGAKPALRIELRSKEQISSFKG